MFHLIKDARNFFTSCEFHHQGIPPGWCGRLRKVLLSDFQCRPLPTRSLATHVSFISCLVQSHTDRSDSLRKRAFSATLLCCINLSTLFDILPKVRRCRETLVVLSFKLAFTEVINFFIALFWRTYLKLGFFKHLIEYDRILDPLVKSFWTWVRRMRGCNSICQLQKHRGVINSGQVNWWLYHTYSPPPWKCFNSISATVLISWDITYNTG